MKGIVESGTVISVGWANEWEEEEVYTVINNYILRVKMMSKLGQELVDGKGGKKISKVILTEFREKR